MPQDFEARRLNELALRAKYGSNAVFTRFLEPSLENTVRSAAAQAEVKAAFSGGYGGAERRIAAFFRWETPQEDMYPLSCIEIKWNPKYASPAHRDLLGAVMGLGLERDSTGDIAMGERDGTAYLFAHRDVESYICANLESAGRASVKAAVCEGPARIRPPKGEEIRVTVSSERLDAVIAAGLKLSRGEAQKLIASGMVKRNHVEELRGDIHLEENDLLSIRGHGRVRVTAFEGLTRKGRLAVRLFKYTG